MVDLFAGPGGLGEGFSSLRSTGSRPSFNIALSIEKDPFAHRTLELRAFFRLLKKKGDLTDYYRYLREEEVDREELFRRHEKIANEARAEACHLELGHHNRKEVLSRISDRLDDAARTRRWVLLGGPPCQAYSVAGRSRMRPVLKEAFDRDHRHTLYREYLAILKSLQPAVFVMENVKGILSSQLRSRMMFQQILSDLQRLPSPYRLLPFVRPKRDGLFDYENGGRSQDFIIEAEKFGIPQARHRVIILGIRSDLIERVADFQPTFLEPQKNAISVKQVISDLPRLRSGLSRCDDSAHAWRDTIASSPTNSWFTRNGNPERHKLDAKLRALIRNWSVPRGDRGGRFVPYSKSPMRFQPKWFLDRSLGGVGNHETRGHMETDLHRYLFASAFAQVHSRSPRLSDFPDCLLPDHSNVDKALKHGTFNDRFRVQVLQSPATTITSHISKDGHYYIHPDPTQCRSLTVREAARLQTFPDNYFFEGPRTEQYHQVGNAVPPLLARELAGIVAGLIAQLL